MTWKRALLGVTLLSLVIASAIGWRVWSLSQSPPEFYTEALQEVTSPAAQEVMVEQLVEQTRELVKEMEQSDIWSETFTEEQINIWLTHLEATHPGVLPKGVHSPRIKIIEGTMYIAFRFQQPRVQGIVSCALEPDVTGRNELTIRFDEVQLGLVPVPIEKLVAEMNGQSHIEGWKIVWRRGQGESAVRLMLDQGEAVQPILETVVLSEGALRVAGSRGPLATGEPVGGGTLQTRNSKTLPVRTVATERLIRPL